MSATFPSIPYGSTGVAERDDSIPAFPLTPDLAPSSSAEERTRKSPPSGPLKTPAGSHLLDLGFACIALDQVRTVSLERLAPNPDHVRTDWDAQDEEHSQLAEQLREAGRPIEPLIVTPAPATTADGERPIAPPVFRIVKGHRRLAAARAAGLGRLPVRVASGEEGRPLRPDEALWYWLVTTHAAKRPSEQQTTVGIARWLWMRIAGGGVGKDALPTQKRLAAYLNVAVGTINRAMRVIEQPAAIVEAVLGGLLQVEVACLLADQIREPESRAAFATRVREQNVERLQAGKPLLPARRVLALVEEEHPRAYYAPALEPRRHAFPVTRAVMVGADDSDDDGEVAPASAAYAPNWWTDRADESGDESLGDATWRGGLAELEIVRLWEGRRACGAVEVLAALTRDLVSCFARLPPADLSHLPDSLVAAYQLLAEADIAEPVQMSLGDR